MRVVIMRFFNVFDIRIRGGKLQDAKTKPLAGIEPMTPLLRIEDGATAPHPAPPPPRCW